MPSTESQVLNTVNIGLLSLGLSGRYNLAKNTNKEFLIEIGINSILPLSVKGNADIFYGNGMTENISDTPPEFNNLGISSSLGVYYKYFLFEKITVFINPQLKYYINGIGETYVNRHIINLTSFEINLGISKTI